MLIPSLSYHRESLDNPYRALGDETGTPLSLRIVLGSHGTSHFRILIRYRNNRRFYA